MGCDGEGQDDKLQKLISIHAARVGCDRLALASDANLAIISIHAARVGCDATFPATMLHLWQFQSTQPEWAATLSQNGLIRAGVEFQSTQPEWAATCTQ